MVYDRFPTDENWEVYTSPLDASARETQRGWPSSYEYSTSFIGDPRIWSGDATAEERWLVGQRESAVLMPSAKAFLWDQGAYPEGWTPQDEMLGVQTAMADGSVRSATLAEAAEPVANPFDQVIGTRKLHNTPMGVQGIDYH